MSFSDDESEEATGLEGDKQLEDLWSKKTRRRSSLLKTFAGDHLDLAGSQKTATLLAKSGERSLLFSDTVIKINRRGKTQDRWLLITDGAIYNIDPHSTKVRRRIPLSNISHLSTSLLSDNFFIVHVPSEYDYVFVGGRKTEIVAVLRLAHLQATREELSISMQNIIDYRIDKDQQRRIVFQQGKGGVFSKIYAKRTR